ncbi:2-dehydro-3-deoxygluconokinase [Dyadobacter sp. CECT 9623]|uniref:2-dehydro-3-deoxygluconokinase n=1 Tax=Dyadobacter linearis TaxID=2823330 RepID=A0ABN7RA63_9BACT|nr:sugar kinase [Dyadobacter sp. CECT 9623]CAG5071630.1 2-dehydro-3-deoxygluconokinase [Dyadobacter sp. CECT 9623]
MAQIVSFGEVLMRLSTPGFSRFEQARQFNVTYAGGEANVSTALAYWGHHTAHVTRFPDSPIGRAAAQYMQFHGVDISHIIYGGPRMAVYYLETGAALRGSQIVYDRANSSLAEIDPKEIDWDSILKDAKWFHWAGITPALSQGAADALLDGIKVARKYGLTVSGDIFYRANLWKYGKKPSEVLPELTAGTDIVIANGENIKEIFGIGGNDFRESCVNLQKEYPQVSTVVDTKRTSISASHNLLRAYLWNGSELLETEDVEINPIIDRVGGGDAFIAGLIHGLITFDDQQKALEFGVAASALKHTIEGDALISTIAEVEAIRQGETSGRIKR